MERRAAKRRLLILNNTEPSFEPIFAHSRPKKCGPLSVRRGRMLRTTICLTLVVAAVVLRAVPSQASAHTDTAGSTAYVVVASKSVLRSDSTIFERKSVEPDQAEFTRVAASRTTSRRLRSTNPAATRTRPSSRTPAHSPDWTNPNPGDPGRTLQTDRRQRTDSR